MFYLSDYEIKKLAKESEIFVSQQRLYKFLFEKNKKGSGLLVSEEPLELAKHMLQKVHHLEDDEVRLAKAIEKNLSSLDWYINKC